MDCDAVAVDPFVAEAENDAVSFPAESWMAFVSLPAVGSVYATVTVSVLTTEDNNPSLTDVPDAETEANEREEPFTCTEKALAADVVDDIDSEKVRVIVVPAAFTAAEMNVGAVESGTPKTEDPLTVAGDAESDREPRPN